uniref:Uncharacterized protein n=1 Tax=Candidatus Kentrum sp. MB TaxID=2138164 RepID=A0A450Y173_9GAMM|nr:MAG: hypothetical protein BECKMB1821G_GA0114241_11073 [Candidatus Kentron sp. MB]VFK35279.1 MAG: hypothetical protein BECKMB1821I_GA0114274_11093 [Candidatus Kentron sp. MB]VFK77178.1 MAG: hypothetical protein BECKMB1821H_GA0114242_11073 [Candidatus Kentron sp. MB]
MKEMFANIAASISELRAPILLETAGAPIALLDQGEDFLPSRP